MSYGIIYLAYCRVSDKGYVGQTTQDIQARWRGHRNGACHAIKAAISKYGEGSFDLSVLGEANSRDELDQLEKYFINEHNTLAPKGYNLKEGGGNGKPTLLTRDRMRISHLGVPLSSSCCESMVKAQKRRREGEKKLGIGPVFTQHSRELMQKAKLGTTLSDETKAKMSASRTGLTPSEETREKLRKAAKGRVVSDETKAKMSAAHKGHKQSEKTKAKRSLALEGRKKSPESIEKTASKNRGKKRTPEQKERMRQARLQYLKRKQEGDGRHE